jgi:diguanylate cyclase (GGDEF)-like protein
MPDNKSIILIVDDEVVSRYTVKALLSTEGYQLEFAENGEEALEKASYLIPDLMLLDVMMPGMDGFEVCQKLRANPRTSELPIVMVTALDDRDSRLRGIEAGADDFMSKPFDRAELRARIRTITRLNRYRRLLESDEKLAYLANYDTLTHLPNRNLLLERLRQALARANRNHQHVTVLALDLDGFQMINDSLGHEAGDQVLCEMAQRLLDAVSSSGATVARLSGDEFIIMGETNNLFKEINEMAQCLLDTISKPITIESHEMVITASIGMSIFPGDGKEAAILLKNADTALSRAKAAGKNTYQFFTIEMNKVAFERLMLENKLRKVLENEELRLYYQPQIDLKTGKMIGMEALLRWQHPELGIVSPDKFVSVAEDMGLIIPIGEWVLRTACQQNQAWREIGLPPMRISVNVSTRQFQQPHLLLETIKQALTDSCLNPSYLELEITESILMKEEGDNNKNDVFSILTELRKMGIQIAVDDFGTGYSSLSYLKRLPVTTLKIDRAFVRDLVTDKDDAAIVKAIIAMAHSLQLIVVAEGIEEKEHLSFLQQWDCEMGQGYLFSRPISTENMTELLHQIPYDNPIFPLN